MSTQYPRLPKVPFRTPWFTIRAVPHKSGAPYYIFDRPDAVTILPYSPVGETLLLKQFRPPLGAAYYEFPMGMVEKGETPRAAAVRELKEETGLTGAEFQSVGWYHPVTAITNQRVHIFAAKVATETLRQAKGIVGEDDIVGSRLVALDTIDAMFAAGEICGASTLLTWHRAKASLDYTANEEPA